MSGPVKRVGFIGIGNMGWPMAANLVKAGFDVAVCDAVPDRAARFHDEVPILHPSWPGRMPSSRSCPPAST
jgi:pyrroline-5-carboxylate reductase